ncbi:hypothetical protein GGR77_003933 [Xanthomonas translucens]
MSDAFGVIARMRSRIACWSIAAPNAEQRTVSGSMTHHKRAFAAFLRMVPSYKSSCFWNLALRWIS